jgi:hypothetical protein
VCAEVLDQRGWHNVLPHSQKWFDEDGCSTDTLTLDRGDVVYYNRDTIEENCASMVPLYRGTTEAFLTFPDGSAAYVSDTGDSRPAFPC